MGPPLQDSHGCPSLKAALEMGGHAGQGPGSGPHPPTPPAAFPHSPTLRGISGELRADLAAEGQALAGPSWTGGGAPFSLPRAAPRNPLCSPTGDSPSTAASPNHGRTVGVQQGPKNKAPTPGHTPCGETSRSHLCPGRVTLQPPPAPHLPASPVSQKSCKRSWAGQ